MSCRNPEISDQIVAWLDGALPSEDARICAAHLETCDECKRDAEFLRTITGRVEKAFRAQRANPIAAICPSVDELVDFCASTAPPNRAAIIEAHVEMCPDCHQQAALLRELDEAAAVDEADTTASLPAALRDAFSAAYPRAGAEKPRGTVISLESRRSGPPASHWSLRRVMGLVATVAVLIGFTSLFILSPERFGLRDVSTDTIHTPVQPGSRVPATDAPPALARDSAASSDAPSDVPPPLTEARPAPAAPMTPPAAHGEETDRKEKSNATVGGKLDKQTQTLAEKDSKSSVPEREVTPHEPPDDSTPAEPTRRAKSEERPPAASSPLESKAALSPPPPVARPAPPAPVARPARPGVPSGPVIGPAPPATPSAPPAPAAGYRAPMRPIAVATVVPPTSPGEVSHSTPAGAAGLKTDADARKAADPGRAAAPAKAAADPGKAAADCVGKRPNADEGVIVRGESKSGPWKTAGGGIARTSTSNVAPSRTVEAETGRMRTQSVDPAAVSQQQEAPAPPPSSGQRRDANTSTGSSGPSSAAPAPAQRSSVSYGATNAPSGSSYQALLSERVRQKVSQVMDLQGTRIRVTVEPHGAANASEARRVHVEVVLPDASRDLVESLRQELMRFLPLDVRRGDELIIRSH